QAAAVEKPEDFEPVRVVTRKRSPANSAEANRPDSSARPKATVQEAVTSSDDRQLLNKHAVEKMTSLDITTIYRRMAAGTFPQPVRVGRRRVAWRTADILEWQQHLDVGTETLRRSAGTALEGTPPGRGRGRHSGR